jgi:hypothetical protein
MDGWRRSGVQTCGLGGGEADAVARRVTDVGEEGTPSRSVFKFRTHGSVAGSVVWAGFSG